MKSKHVHLLAHEPARRFGLSIILRRAGYTVTVTADGFEALKKLRLLWRTGRQVDLLLADSEVPGLPLQELLGRLAEERLAPPTIAMTAHAGAEIIEELRRRGCTEYQDGPFETDNLLRVVENALARTASEPEGRMPSRPQRPIGQRMSVHARAS